MNRYFTTTNYDDTSRSTTSDFFYQRETTAAEGTHKCSTYMMLCIKWGMEVEVLGIVDILFSTPFRSR